MANFIALKQESENINRIAQRTLDLPLIIGEQLNIPKDEVKKGIKEGLLTFNNKVVHYVDIILKWKVVIRYNNVVVRIPPYRSSKLNRFIDLAISDLHLSKKNMHSLEAKLSFTTYVIEFLWQTEMGIDELLESQFGDFVFKIFEDVYKEKFAEGVDLKVPKRKVLFNKLVTERDMVFQELEKVTTSVESNLYDLNKPHIFQDYGRCFSAKAFKYLVQPLVGREFDFPRLIHSIINTYKSVLTKQKIDDKIHQRIVAFNDLKNYQTNPFLLNDQRLHNCIERLIQYIKSKCREVVEFSDTGKPDLVIETVNRTYDLIDRTTTIYAFITNAGTGIAKHVTIEHSTSSKQQVADFLAPSKKIKVQFDLPLSDSEAHDEIINLTLKLACQNELNQKILKTVDNFLVKIQQTDLPWEELRRSSPYGINIVEDPQKLFGREDFMRDLRWNIEESSNIMSYVIYGQKRVGKSSLVRTLDTIYKDHPEIIYIYKTVGTLKKLEPEMTFLKLGRVLFSKLIQEFKKRNPKIYVDEIAAICDFDGSLSGLTEVIDELQDYTRLRIIFAIDEFDELNKEFFDNTELGKTFALNLGKGLNDRSNVGFILIGSETMEQKTKQGMRLNAFELKKVDSFDQQYEFTAYSKIITEPTKSCLKFSDEAINFVFDYTNGNPYFTNVLLGKVFKEAYDKRISYLDLDFIKNTSTYQVNNFLSQKDFQHFWDDGLSEQAVTYEKVLDRRRRLLTAFTECKKEKENITWNDIKKKIKYPKRYTISENQMEDTLNEFKQRNIVIENEGALRIVPKLFEDWLMGHGLFQVISQLEDKDEILDLVQQEMKLFLTDDELTEIYNYLQVGNQKNGSAQLRKFLDQFHDNQSKRMIADLLLKSVIITASEAVDFIKKCRKEIFTEPMELAAQERNLRKDIELFSSPDTIRRNKQYLDIIKSQFKIAANRTVKPVNDFVLEDSVKKVIYFEAIIDCPYFFRNEISKFVKRINPLNVRKIKIHIMAFLIVDEAKEELEKLLSDYFAYDFQLHYLRSVQRSDISPYLKESDTINDPTWKLISGLDKAVSNLCCLVKIGELVPQQVFPFIWSERIKNFSPLFPYPSDEHSSVNNRQIISDQLKNLKFENESNQIEFKASLSEPSINWKGILKLVRRYKELDLEKIGAIGDEIEALWSLKSNDKQSISKGLKHSIAKTIAAFSNTAGGQLIVGIDDDFTVSGLTYDLRICKSKEGVLALLDTIVDNYIGKEFSKILTAQFIDIDNVNMVLKITVQKSSQLIWVLTDKEGKKLTSAESEFYIRQNQETRKLGPREVIAWQNVDDN